MGDAVHQVVVVGKDLWGVPAIRRQLTARRPASKSPPLVVLNWNELMPGLLQSIKVDLASGLIFYVALIFVVAFRSSTPSSWRSWSGRGSSA